MATMTETGMTLEPTKLLEIELAFTEAFRRYENAHPAIREARCLAAMYPALCLPIQEKELLAGRVARPAVGFHLEQEAGGFYYHCDADAVRRRLAEWGSGPDERRAAEEMLEFWSTRTSDRVMAGMLGEPMRSATNNRIADMGFRMAGALLDFDKLVHVGIPGLAAEVRTALERHSEGPDQEQLYEAMLAALDVVAEVCRHYAAQARALAADSCAEPRRLELQTMARSLDAIVLRPPNCLQEALQLTWLYALAAGVLNHGRMDVYAGDFYVADVDSGRLTEEQALALLQSQWRLIAERPVTFNGRIIVGGRGRRNEANADRFALAAMEATRTVHEAVPQLSLRWYRRMNPALMAKALEVIGEGRTYPILYNDDVNVPAVATAFNVSEADAEQYLPYGCGEYALDHRSIGSPNCSLNTLKALEAVLHNGRDGMTGEPLGITSGPLSSFDTFEQLFSAYRRQVEYHARYLVLRHAVEYEMERQTAGFVLVSMLYDHCIERGRSVVDGGTRYRGAVIESFGIVNTADALYAIKECVYERKIMTLERLVEALDADWNGYERERLACLGAAKFGNDHAEADRMADLVSRHAATYTCSCAREAGLDYALIVNINNHMNVGLGRLTAASADGRRAGAPLANGMTPTAGNDRSGVTALLNSLARIDPSVHAGYVHNLKFSRDLFVTRRTAVAALLQGYFASGGTQAMITVVGRDDLARAMEYPEEYRHLFVRVGGFSARFVDLPRETQLDILQRTLYE